MKNFKKMKQLGFQIMIRGHDHKPTYVYEDQMGEIYIHNPEKNNTKFKLWQDRTHTITPGAFLDGYYAIIDTKIPGEKTPVLTYHKLN
ncbi:hypothetical protein ACFL6H_06360 [Candidatus Latescibacterota bacterium]